MEIDFNLIRKLEKNSEERTKRIRKKSSNPIEMPSAREEERRGERTNRDDGNKF